MIWAIHSITVMEDSLKAAPKTCAPHILANPILIINQGTTVERRTARTGQELDLAQQLLLDKLVGSFLINSQRESMEVDRLQEVRRDNLK